MSAGADGEAAESKPCKNPESIPECGGKNPMVCQWLHPMKGLWCTADCAIMLAAAQQDGHALKYATEAHKADRAIVLAAVQQGKRDRKDFLAACLCEAPAAKGCLGNRYRYRCRYRHWTGGTDWWWWLCVWPIGPYT